MCVHTHARAKREGKRGRDGKKERIGTLIPWHKWESEGDDSTMWGTGIELGSSGLTGSTFTH